MLCFGFEPGTAGWQAQTDSLSYGGRPGKRIVYLFKIEIAECRSKLSKLFRFLERNKNFVLKHSSLKKYTTSLLYSWGCVVVERHLGMAYPTKTLQSNVKTFLEGNSLLHTKPLSNCGSKSLCGNQLARVIKLLLRSLPTSALLPF